MKKKVVYGFMVADLPHEGHVRYIQQSKALGDYLIIGVLTSEAVETYKPKPVMSLRERMKMVSSIKGVDEVVVQHSRDPSANILKHKPDIVTHGDDWPLATFPGKNAMGKVGAWLAFTKYYHPQSTSKIRKKIGESKARSMTKSILWRVMGIAILALITYLFTGSLITATLITFFHHLAFVFIYYFHERVWLRAKNRWLLKWKRWVKPITYEIVLGHLVLGAISFVFTGSWTAVTLITIVYIENKLWIYVVYDWVWDKIRWGK